MAKQGRPFTYQSDEEKPVMVSARLPKVLTALVTRYAKERQQSLSTLIKEGLEWRIGDGDPRGSGMYLAQPGGMSEKLYDSHTTTAPTAHEAEALQEVRALLARQWEQIQALAQAMERQQVGASHGMYDSNTASEAGSDTAPAHNSHTVIQEAQHAAAGSPKPDKATVKAYIHQLREQGLFYAQIAAQLNADGIPTHTGRGTWAKGSVERVISGRKTASTSAI